MWSKTYTNTLKIIVRSTTFWLLFIILMTTAVSGAIGGFYVGDDEPDVVLSYNDYIQVIANSLISTLAFTALPLFCIVTTVLALNRDYGDDFFEIEKAAGIKYFKYLLGRLTAIISIAAIATVISHSLCLHLYLFTRGGVPHLGQWHYFGDSIVRMLRIDLCVMLPSLIFYIDWSCENWGTKWGACHTYYVDENNIEFDTAWSCPFKIFEEISKKYNTRVEVEFADEDIGNNCGIVIYDKGEEIGFIEGDRKLAYRVWDYTDEEIEEIERED